MENFANQLIDSIQTLTQATHELYRHYENKEYDLFEELSTGFMQLLNNIGILIENKQDENLLYIKDGIIQNISSNFNEILVYFKVRSQMVFKRIEFTLIPLLNEFYINAHYVCNVENKEEFFAKELKEISANPYIEEGYKYDISIVLTSDGDFESTKNCLQHIFNYTPSYINYELILVNNSDCEQVQDFFNSFAVEKQFTFISDVKGELNSKFDVISTVYEGEYYLNITNNIQLENDYISNMMYHLKEFNGNATMLALKSKSGKLVEDTRADKNNLNNLVEIGKTSNVLGYKSKNFDEIYGTKCTAVFRKEKDENIVNINTFCKKFCSQGEIEYYCVFSFGTNIKFSPNLITSLSFLEKEEIKILGINCNEGGNTLKIKQVFKNSNVIISNVAEYGPAILELEKNSQNIYEENNIDTLNEVLLKEKFNYIIFESKREDKIQAIQIVNALLPKFEKGLKIDGILAMKNSEMPKNIQELFKTCVAFESKDINWNEKENWHILRRI